MCSNYQKSALLYARRESNPQPSEPESDALSIEPQAHERVKTFILTYSQTTECRQI